MTPEAAVEALSVARRERRAVTPFTDDHPDLDEAWGYAAQRADRGRRLAAGETVVGAKLGLTSVAKQQRMHVGQPIVGFLTDAMARQAVGGLDLSAWIQPRIEPEIAFVLGADLTRPLTLDTVGEVVAAVTVAAEIIDSRFSGYRFRLPDVVADDTSAAGFAVSATLRPLHEVDLATVRCALEVDGVVVEAATGAAILGNPLLALVHLSEHLAARGEQVPAGSVVLAGAVTDAVPLATGHRYRVVGEGLGEIDLQT